MSAIFSHRGLAPNNSKMVIAFLIGSSCIFGATTGYDGSIISGFNIMPSYKAYFALTTLTRSTLTASYFMGSTVACLGFGQIANKWGRRTGIFLSACFKIIGVVLMASAQNYGMFLSGRLILGFGAGASGSAAPTLLAETLPYKLRGPGLSMIWAVYFVGALTAAGVTYATSAIEGNLSWRIPAALQVVWSVITLILLPFTPESPRWLARQGRFEDALEVVALAHSNGDINDPTTIVQFKEIQDTLNWEKEHGETLTRMQTLKAPGPRKRILLITGVAACITLSGNNIVAYYLGDMLTNAGISDSHTQLQINIGISAWCLVCAIVGSQLVERLGRRTMGMLSIGGCCIFLFLIGGLTKLFGVGSHNQSGVYATVAMIYLFQGSFAFGMTNLTLLYPPEVLNYTIRATGMAWFTACVNVFGLFGIFALPLGLAAIGYQLYFINGIWTVLEFAFVYFFWVETRGRSLEEIDAYFDGEKHSSAPNMSDLASGKVADQVLEGLEEEQTAQISTELPTTKV